MIGILLFTFVIAVALGDEPVKPDLQNLEGHRSVTGLNLITRSPQSELDLPPNEIHSRHQYERRKTVKVLLEESIRNQTFHRKNSSDTKTIGSGSLG
jgi:hypothetical protein